MQLTAYSVNGLFFAKLGTGLLVTGLELTQTTCEISREEITVTAPIAPAKLPTL
jgi:hypothetical protein